MKRRPPGRNRKFAPDSLDLFNQYANVQGRLRCRFCFITEGHGLGVQGFGWLDLVVRLVMVTLRCESLATLDYRNTMEAVMDAIDDKERSDA